MRLTRHRLPPIKTKDPPLLKDRPKDRHKDLDLALVLLRKQQPLLPRQSLNTRRVTDLTSRHRLNEWSTSSVAICSA